MVGGTACRDRARQHTVASVPAQPAQPAQPAHGAGSAAPPLHLAHWGRFSVDVRGGDVASVHPWAGDSEPPALQNNLVGSLRHPCRVARPAVRRGWWEQGPGPDDRRGAQDFLQPPWDEVLDAVTAELRRVIDQHGNQAIYGGSYGWASAGRFHHAPTQLHRFLHLLGGFTGSVNTYSTGAAEVILPRVIGGEDVFGGEAASWGVIAEHTELLVCFGGLSARTAAIDWGGTGDHPVSRAVTALTARGGRIVSLSPLRDDLAGARDDPEAPVRWLPISPGTDVTVLLAIAWVLHTDGLADRQFLARYCLGYEPFATYLQGEVDGVPKTPAWAAAISGVPAADIEALAHALARHRSMLAMSWSLQRSQYGEQAPWLGAVIAAMLGQLGLPGGGFTHGYGSMNKVGQRGSPWPLPTLSPGVNRVRTRIPVAAISDLLLAPGSSLSYAGTELTLPDVRLVYWAGGNPFHHHQDLFRLRRAFNRPDTIVVHDPYWTSTARHADVVFPSTVSLERDDLGGSRHGGHLVAMRALASPYEQARDDYDMFSALAQRLGVAEAFTEGRTAQDWVRQLYQEWAALIAARFPDDVTPATFDRFWGDGSQVLPRQPETIALAAFRADPQAHPRPTPSGLIEITSDAIAALRLPDCPGHPTWLDPQERLGTVRAATYPLLLLANQPGSRFHSQFDFGPLSAASKIAGREPLRMHPADAAARGLVSGTLVRVFNDRGALLAGVLIDDAVRPEVVQLATGAWFDPVPGTDSGGPGLCAHGNPNVLTPDIRTSSLAQACAGAHALVQVEAYDGEPPPLRCQRPPELA